MTVLAENSDSDETPARGRTQVLPERTVVTTLAKNSGSDVDRRTKSASFGGDFASLFRSLYEKEFMSEACVFRLNFPAVRNS